MKSVISFNDVSFEFANGTKLFDQLNFTIEPILTGLVGPNGIGKSTLAKLMTGEFLPTTGSIRKNKSISFLPQKLSPAAISVEQYLTPDYVWSPFAEHLLEGLDRQTLCTHLSGGQWMRVRLANVLYEDFLILDEPTNDLDRDGRQALLGFLKQKNGGAFLISHDRKCLELCENIFELSNRGMELFGGGWLFYENAKVRERQNLNRNLEFAKKERDQLSDKRQEQKQRQNKRNQRGAKDSSKIGLPKILIGARKRQAQKTTGKIESSTFRRSEVAIAEAYSKFTQVKTAPTMYGEFKGIKVPNQKLVAEAFHFNIRLNDWLYKKSLTFSWRGNIRMTLKGPNGSGKSTLLSAILGTNYETQGELRVGNMKTVYIDQRCSFLDESESVLDIVRKKSTLDESEIRNYLAKFLFTKDTVFQKIHTLSGGERLRVALARRFLTEVKPEFLILDEPTNNLDLDNIKFIENLIREFQGAVLVISHDEIFLSNCGIQDELSLV